MDYEAQAREFIRMMPLMRAAPRHHQVDKISKGEGHMLAHLKMNGGSMMAGELAKCSCVSTARVAAMLKGTEEKGYIKRLPVEGDRRKIQVVLTAEGEEIVTQGYEEAVSSMSNFLQQLGEEDTEHLMRIMGKAIEILNKGEQTV